MKKIIKIILFLFVFVILYLGILYFVQDFFILHPDKEYVGSDKFTEKMLEMSDHTQVRLWISEGQKDKPLILFFHGNRGQNSYLSESLLPLIQNGFPVVMMEYRGFAKAPGRFTQKRILQDSTEVYDWLSISGYQKIIPYGYSLGTSVATYLASQRHVQGLILTAPFVSLKRLVSETHLPFTGFILKYPFETDSYAKLVKAPVLIMHGQKDPTIPYQHSQQLYDFFASTDKTLEFFENDTHRSLFFEKHNIPTILKWLSEKIQ